MPTKTAAANLPAPAGAPAAIDVLVCYRGRYHPQVQVLAQRLRAHGLTVTYDREILNRPPHAPPAADAAGEPDREWLSMGDAAVDADVAWRGPLRKAVGKAWLSVFLYDARDLSVNVINEIAWVARAGRHVFFAIDTGPADTSEDFECVVLGTLQAWFALSLGTLNAEIPRFGYEFVAHAAPDAMQHRLDVLVNRVLGHVERLRQGDLPTMRLDSPMTMDDLRQAPLVRARERLRTIQARFAEAPHTPGNGATDRFHEILALQLERERGTTVSHGRLYLPSSLYAYPEGTERQRLARTEALIQRSRPGPHEVVALYPELARQAASVELHIDLLRHAQWRQAGAAGPYRDYQPAIVLGSVPFALRRSVPLVSQEAGNAVLLLNLGFVNFCYQLIKLTVLSWRLTRGEPGQPASFQFRHDDVRQVHEARPDLGQALLTLVRSYAERAVPEASLGPPSLPCQLPLSLMTAYAERFTLAHGYAQLGELGPSAPAALSQQADIEAATVVLVSATLQDRVEPMIALQGCLLAVIADQLLASALALYPDAAPGDGDQADTLRRQRCDALVGTYLAGAQAAGMAADDAQDAAQAATEAADAVLQLWQRIEPQFVAGLAADARPSPVWRTARPRPATSPG